jgi:hypothetical protein
MAREIPPRRLAAFRPQLSGWDRFLVTMQSLTSRLSRLAAGVAMSCAALALGASFAAADATSDYNAGLALGTQAYQYGVPLLDTERIFTSSAKVSVCNPLTGHGPVNQFCNARDLANATEHTVNAPNNDTLYSLAWLDLSKQPQVLHAPAIKHRFWEFELVDPWTNNFFNMTSAHKQLGKGDFNVTGGGNWAVVGPGFTGRLPRGAIRVNAPYNRVWVIGRTYIRGPSDLDGVHRIQAKYAITPLSKFGTSYTAPRPKHIVTGSTDATIPGTQPGEDPLTFYAALGREMLRFPAPGRDRPLLNRIRAVGVGPGLSPATAHLSAATLQGLRDAVTKGPAKLTVKLLALYSQEFAAHNGYLVGDLGDWGTNYTLRAIGDKVGVGGQRASIATYPFALLDDTKAPLTGSRRYVLHIPKTSLPIPVKAFWSLTLYDSSSYFVPNPLNRWVINNRSHLRRNADGSIDIYVQNNRPSNPAQVSNWLPAPQTGAGFRLIWRLYDLDNAVAGVLDGSGWQPPPIQPCSAAAVGSLGTACAS